jgi:hypothetical protein
VLIEIRMESLTGKEEESNPLINRPISKKRNFTESIYAQ